jgi:hypothetical protein
VSVDAWIIPGCGPLGATAGGIAPIVAVDGRQVADGHAGALTRRIAERYWQMHTDPRHAIQVIR